MSNIALKSKPSKKSIGVTPLSRRELNMQLMIVDVLLDFSGSMEPYFDLLLECYNEYLLPMIFHESRKRCSAVRIGAMLFSDEIVKPWDGFLSADEISQRPLAADDYKQRGLNGRTALYRAMIESIERTDQFAKAIRGRYNAKPMRKIMIFTDGTNNRTPRSPLAVSQAIKIFNPSKHDTISLIYFKTQGGLSEEGFKKMANRMGVTNSYFINIVIGKENNLDSRKNTFRHEFRELLYRDIG